MNIRRERKLEMTNAIFKNVVAENFPTLEKMTPIVARVHGDGHPELTDVRDIFQNINEKVQTSEEADLKQDFEQLRTVTNNYEVPADGCEAYTTTYELLEEADKVYHSK